VRFDTDREDWSDRDSTGRGRVEEEREDIDTREESMKDDRLESKEDSSILRTG